MDKVEEEFNLSGVGIFSRSLSLSKYLAIIQASVAIFKLLLRLLHLTLMQFNLQISFSSYYKLSKLDGSNKR